MLVVSDASPINILIRIGYIDILQRLYGTVVVPPTVLREMSHPDTPTAVRQWIQTPPSWVSVRKPAIEVPPQTPGRGEQEAIALALELKADLLLVDDLKARSAAEKSGLSVTGTLGVLERAAECKLLDLKQAVDELRKSDFRITDDLLDQALERDPKRRSLMPPRRNGHESSTPNHRETAKDSG